MGKASAPKAPDPKETAAAQTSTNISTAVANSALNNVNQVTPYGSLTYTQSGQQFISDPNGQQLWYNPTTGVYSQNAPTITGYTTSSATPTTSNGSSLKSIPGTRRDRGNTSSGSSAATTTQTPIYEGGWQQVQGNLIPTYTATQELSPEQQAILDQTQAAQLNLGSLANQQSSFLKDYMATPFDGSNEATEARLMELGRKRLDPALSEQDEALRTRLANQGIKAGSTAYDRELTTQNQSRNDAYNQLILNGRNQAFSEALQTRNQPINEITALLSGSQVTAPTYAQTAQSNIPTTDYAGLVQQNYQNELSAWQQQQQTAGGILGGLFGLGGKLIGLSDERAKKNVKPVGKLMGQKLYSFDYKKGKGDGKHHVGVMAQEVEKTRPDAVTTRSDGMKQVDYGKLFAIGAGKVT